GLGDTGIQQERVRRESMNTVRFKLHRRKVGSQHKYPSHITILAGDGKVKIKCAPEPGLPSIVEFKREAAKMNILIKHLHLHLAAVAQRGSKSNLFYLQGIKPIINSQT